MNHVRMSIGVVFLLFASALLGGWQPPISESSSSISDEPNELREEVKMEAASPGHAVFAQYISSDNCGHCSKPGGGSDAHHNLKQSNGDEYVYITYMSASYGNTADARAGNVNPIRAVSHLGQSGGAPKSYFGDTFEIVGADSSGHMFDAEFSSGGHMPSNMNDFAIQVKQVQNGANADITISGMYLGSGSAPSVTVYAAVVEDLCTSYTYSSGISHGHNCWKTWLLDGGNWVNKNGGSGGGSGFATMQLATSTWTDLTWTIPNNHVDGGFSNMITIGALYSGWSTTSMHEDVYAVSDSTMVPLIDLGVGATITNESGASQFEMGEVLTIDATVTNNGVEAYEDGGNIEFFTDFGGETILDTFSLSNFPSTGSVQPFQTTFDTSTLVGDPWDVSIGVRLTGLTDDMISLNNIIEPSIPQDRAPRTSQITVIGNGELDRGSNLTVEVTGTSEDNVDELSQLTPTLQFSPHGADDWSTTWITGGDVFYGQGTSSERYEFVITPDEIGSAGFYDLRASFTDPGGHVGEYLVKENMFELMNAAPIITDDPIPTVRVEITERVDMSTHIWDAETPLSELNVTSESANFLGWYPDDGQIEVRFDTIQKLGEDVIPSGIFISVNDGTDTSTGTLHFNVIENGAPRWRELPTQSFIEGGSVSIALTQYLSDTDDVGEPVDASLLDLRVVGLDNESLIRATLHGHLLDIEALDEDSFGTVVVTLRASDGEQQSETTLVVHIINDNDAPRINTTVLLGLQLLVGEEMLIDMTEHIWDIDDPNVEIFTSVESDDNGADFSLLSNELSLMWQTAGVKSVSLKAQDRHDAVTWCNFTVEVLADLPLGITLVENETGDLFVTLENFYAGEIPTIHITSISELSLTDLTVSWQVCNHDEGICYDGATVILPDSTNGTWSFQPTLTVKDAIQFRDDLKLQFSATDGDGSERVDETWYEWLATEYPPEEIDDGNGDGTNNGGDGSDLEGAGESDSNGMNLMVLGGMGLVVIFLLLALLVKGRGRKESPLETAWVEELPAADAVANSMYGGAADVFQTPVAASEPTSVAPAPAPAPTAETPPLPPGGLPPGWTMEQWQFYGHQYQQ